MKCLSLKQPYAALLANGKKTIEIRKWNTHYRGEFLIHASKNINIEACSILDIDKDILVTGAIIGKGVIYDVKIYSTFNDFKQDGDKHFSIEKNPVSANFKRYGFLVRDTHLFKEPIPCTGKLNFFEVDLF